MAARKPVVATRVGGTPEVIKDGVTGLLVPPRDPKALAEAIIALLQDRERAKAMGQAGRERVEKYFSVERMVQETEALYEELIREKMGLEWAEREGVATYLITACGKRHNLLELVEALNGVA